MGEPESSTPRSTTETPQLKAAKDKNCPFCGQAFTSSSLGRHLDLYIRPKNPKTADGIHLVDEIRKLRGGITRRQAKGSVSLSRRDDRGTSTPANKKQSITSEGSSTLAHSPEEDDDDELHVEKTRSHFKDVSWSHGKRQPSRAMGVKTPDMRRDASRLMQKADLDQRFKSIEEVEIASATEMALRELLKSVRDASTKSSGSTLFDFDPYTLNFPSLCLQILPPPSTLFSPTPFPTAESWSITPPGQKQLDALNKQVRERLLAQQRQRQINQVYPAGANSNPASANNSPLPTPPLFDPDPQKLFCHIADAFTHWMQQSERTRLEYWQIEILRCYARADERRREAEVQLENARREIEYLKANRWTTGATDISPITINLSTDTTKELGKFGMDFRNWDYDRLIEKCRGVIREGKASTSGMAAQRPLPGDPASTRSCSMVSVTPHAFVPINKTRQGSPVKVEGLPFTAPPTISDEPSNDQLDAEGDDDEDLDLDHHAGHEDQPMIEHQPQPMRPHQQQQHHMSLQPTSLHHSQQVQQHMQAQMHASQAQAQAHMQAQANAQAQAHAQAQAWAAARQHMNQSRNQNYSPHQHQQLSPHVQHVSQMGSAASSRRPSLQMMDQHAMNQNMQGAMSMSTGMDGISSHQDQFLNMDMGLTAGFVGSNDGGVGMGH
ncbi:hypothetical protein HBH69_156970 [Parastagonospora nodorum]|nr:hypothetical protein HBH51_157930 [Parastagonospora nodorum]KAH4260445.1 hypothetical protein HBI03_126930 [Parastagonospora nodorum]KAH4267940.1 hypothetical protein HBI04_166850 [Parastagonospora nodorum]KAH4605846.1 hypothetical protein HBH82_115970 [Parastagonospora nodorum]KAH4702763.1 hypothetical protein HBH67_130570 [Parastagonospora nodorum]